MEVSVLDHGYCKLVEHWGSDERIIESARMSTDGSFRGWESDDKLLSYLWKHKHYSPFEFPGFTVEVQAPIFVVREWHRHRTQSYNELSGRYTALPNLYYTPSVERLMAGRQSQKNKQGSEDGFTEAEAILLRSEIIYAAEQARQRYDFLLERGLSRELARCIIPVNQYTKFRASANLRNWLHFLGLRLDRAAQVEIQEYAKAIGGFVQELFPRTYALFEEGSNA